MAMQVGAGRDEHEGADVGDEVEDEVVLPVRAVPDGVWRVGDSPAGVRGGVLDYSHEGVGLGGFPVQYVGEHASGFVEDVRGQPQRELGRVDDHAQAVGGGVARCRWR